MEGRSVSVAWPLWMALLMLQIVLSCLLYDPGSSQLLRILGCAVGCCTGLLGVWPMITLRRRGGVPLGQGYTHTTRLVTSGLYAVVRHPQYLSFMLLSLFLILIMQHWLSAVVGIAAIAAVYFGLVPQADRANLAKFGADYQRYRSSVPRLNIVAGVVRMLRRNKRAEEP